MLMLPASCFSILLCCRSPQPPHCLCQLSIALLLHCQTLLLMLKILSDKQTLMPVVGSQTAQQFAILPSLLPLLAILLPPPSPNTNSSIRAHTHTHTHTHMRARTHTHAHTQSCTHTERQQQEADGNQTECAFGFHVQSVLLRTTKSP